MSGRALIKICGVTRVEDALAAAELGVDLVGLNFAPESPRRVSFELAAEIATAVRGRLRLAGVFVEASAAEIRRALDELGLDLVQLHGEEPAEAVAALGARAIRVFRGAPSAAAIGKTPRAGLFLVDAPPAPGGPRGGAGRTWTWETLAGLRFPAPVLVAGGIAPGNVARALAASGADGVDVASGVESVPGIKDPEKMRRLVEEVIRYGSSREG